MDKLAERARMKGVQIPRGPRAEDIERLADASFVPDRSRANGSTIAVLAEYEGKSCLLAGDAFAEVMTLSIRRLENEWGKQPISVDAVKLPHHGSRRNVSVDLLRAVAAPTYLFSTDGSVLGHPDPEAVARVLRYGTANAKLAFNYRSEQTTIWDDNELMERYGYQVIYPDEGQAGLRLECNAGRKPPRTQGRPLSPHIWWVTLRGG